MRTQRGAGHCRAPCGSVACSPRRVWLVAASSPGRRAAVAGRRRAAAAARRASGGSAGSTAALAPLLGLVGSRRRLPGARRSGAARGTARGARRARLLVADARRAAARRQQRACGSGPAAGSPARAVWEGSLDSAATHVIGPLLSTRRAARRCSCGRSARRAAVARARPQRRPGRVAAAVWSGALVAAAPLLDGGLLRRAAPAPARRRRSARYSQPRSRSPPARCAVPSDAVSLACLTAAGAPRRGRRRRARAMNVLKSVETTIADLVEGAFGRVFRSEVRPSNWRASWRARWTSTAPCRSRASYAPNEYSVWLSPEDRARYEGVEHEVIDELCAYLLEHARRENLILASQPQIAFHTDERALARRVRHPGAAVVSAAGERGRRTVVPPTSRPGWYPRPQRAPRRAWADDDLQHLGTCARPGRGGAGAASAPARCCRSAAGACAIPRRGRDRAQPRLRHRARRRRGLAPARRDPPGRGRLDPRPISARPTACASTAADRGAQLLHAGDRIELGSTEVVFDTRMTTLAPVSVALKFGFLAVLYLFLLWVARSALRDLRGAAAVRVQAGGAPPPPDAGDRSVLGLRGGRRRHRRSARRGWWSSARRGTIPG